MDAGQEKKPNKIQKFFKDYWWVVLGVGLVVVIATIVIVFSCMPSAEVTPFEVPKVPVTLKAVTTPELKIESPIQKSVPGWVVGVEDILKKFDD